MCAKSVYLCTNCSERIIRSMSYITKTQPTEHGSVRIIKNTPTKPATQRHLTIHTTFKVSCAFNNLRIKTIKTKKLTLKLISKKLRYDMKFLSTIIPAVFETILTNGFVTRGPKLEQCG